MGTLCEKIYAYYYLVIGSYSYFMISSYRTNKKKVFNLKILEFGYEFSIYYQSLSTYSYPYSISNMIYFTQMQFSFFAYKCVYVCELVMSMMAPSFCVLVLICCSFFFNS